MKVDTSERRPFSCCESCRRLSVEDSGLQDDAEKALQANRQHFTVYVQKHCFFCRHPYIHFQISFNTALLLSYYQCPAKKQMCCMTTQKCTKVTNTHLFSSCRLSLQLVSGYSYRRNRSRGGKHRDTQRRKTGSKLHKLGLFDNDIHLGLNEHKLKKIFFRKKKKHKIFSGTQQVDEFI